MDNRKRIDFTKIEGTIPLSPIYYMPQIPSAIYRIEWKLVDIEGVRKNYYYTSTTGQVVNINNQIIHPKMINSGYYVYALLSDVPSPKHKHVLCHRLFMLVFNPIDNPENYTVNHKNLDKSNNYLYNIEWMTYAENNFHKDWTCNNSGVNNYKSQFNIQQLKIIVKELQKGTSYKDILKLIGMDDTDNNRDYIGNIKRGKTYKKEVREILGG